MGIDCHRRHSQGQRAWSDPSLRGWFISCLPGSAEARQGIRSCLVETGGTRHFGGPLTANDGEKKDQHRGDEAARAPQHSQTLPMITEETIEGRPAPSQPVTTPVMPPNPIRRDETARSRPSAGMEAPVPQTEQTAPEAAVTQVKSGGGAEEEKKSEGRISATQLIAGAGAAATSSVIGGQLGVAGTVVGAGIASIITGLAVTLYGRSLDKGKVGSKLAPAVKAQIAKGTPALNGTARVPARTQTQTEAQPQAEAQAQTETQTHDDSQHQTPTETGARAWWHTLRRKRVLYPVAIGVAAFGIGLGGVVMAESFTDADISPGTSQISRSVSGSSGSGEDSGTGGSSDSGSSDSGSSGSGSGSQPGTDSTTGNADEGSSASSGESTSAGESSSEGTTTGTRTDQGTDTSAGTGDTGDGSTSTGAGGSSDTGGSGTSSGSGGSSGGADGGTGGSGGGSAGAGGSGADASGASAAQG